MTSRWELRKHFADCKKYAGGVICYYCKEKKTVAMYRIYQMQTTNRDIVYTVCPDCIDKAKKSRIADQWKKWRG